MNKKNLLNLIAGKDKKKAIKMILSNYADYGSPDGLLVSARKFEEIAEVILEYLSIVQPIDPLDDENSDISQIGREIAEMTDEEFANNLKGLERLLKKNLL